MKRYLKLLVSGIKYSSYLAVATATTGFCYLQYINSKIGPILIEKEQSTKFYMNNLKMDESEAKNMYYWILWDISMMRIFTYQAYSSYCLKLKNKIVDPMLRGYDETGLLKRIEENEEKCSTGQARKLFKEVNEVRKKNLQGVIEYEYIIKEVRKHQKLMDSRRLLYIDGQSMMKISRIHKFVCETGIALKQNEVQEYVSQIPEIQRRLPGDVLHKIMFI